MKRFLPYILILTVIVQLFAPFTVGMGIKNKVEIQAKTVEAADCDEAERTEYNNVFNLNSEGELTDSTIQMTTQVTTSEDSIRAYFNLILDTGEADSIKVADAYRHTYEYYNEFHDEDFVVVVKEKASNKVTGFIDVNELVLVNEKGESLVKKYPNGPARSEHSAFLIGTDANPGIFSPDKNYTVTFYYQAKIAGNGCGESIEGLSDSKDYIPIASTEITIGPVGTAVGNGQTSAGNKVTNPITDPLDCGWNNFKGCVAMVPYYLFFVPSSAVFSISGKIFDFAFGYSVQDSSYRNPFVVEGWGIIRDFCNMFFIFILLYIAIGTILNLHGVKTKEMIINVVIIGLLINFSLFATHVIIDASNILARVFYTSEKIKIEEKNPDGSIKQVATGEYIKLSEAIVSKVNPQELILNAGTVGSIPDKGGMGEKTSEGEISLATLVLIILLASAVNIVGTIVFVSVALIFVGRVIGLWLAMIFVPFTFFTYAVPSLQDLEMVGWKKWWPETVKMAFLAPVFIFFMYLIIKFLNLKIDLTNTAGKSSMDFIVAILLPFAFIMILMWKAKGIAVKMSGTIGEMASKAGAAIGGVGLAMATGGAAMAMRGTVGRIASGVANSESLKEDAKKGGFTGFQARMRLRAASGVSKSSFDVRNTKAGAMAGKELGLDLGKAKEGGFKGYEDRKIKRKMEDAKNLEMSASEAAEQDRKAKADPTHMTLTAAQVNQKRKNEYAKNLGTASEVNAAVSRELTKGQLSDEEVAKTTKSLATTEKELGVINTNLEKLATTLGIKADEITQTDINNSLKSRGGLEEQLTIKETEIIKWTSALTKNPKDATALRELGLANIDKNKLKNEIAETKTLINDRETYTGRQTQLKEKLKAK